MGVSAQIIQLIRRRLQKDEELGKRTAPFFFLIKMKQYKRGWGSSSCGTCFRGIGLTLFYKVRSKTSSFLELKCECFSVPLLATWKLFFLFMGVTDEDREGRVLFRSWK